MKGNKSLEELQRVESDSVMEYENVKKFKRNCVIMLAACFIVIVICLRLFSRIDMPLSEGFVSARYVSSFPKVNQSFDLAWCTEQELFSQKNICIFRGTIKEIKNIQINMGGDRSYRAIAKIHVSKVYGGDCRPTDEVTVLLPCPVDIKGYWVEDAETASKMKAGMEGIFMPVKYDKNSYRMENGATLYYMDLAQYGFMDGVRYAFLKADDGIVYSREAYKSLNKPESLEDVEKYIEKMIK